MEGIPILLTSGLKKELHENQNEREGKKKEWDPKVDLAFETGKPGNLEIEAEKESMEGSQVENIGFGTKWSSDRRLEIKDGKLFGMEIGNFGIELSFQEVPLQVLSLIYNVSPLSSRWISVVPVGTLETPKQKSTFQT